MGPPTSMHWSEKDYLVMAVFFIMMLCSCLFKFLYVVYMDDDCNGFMLMKMLFWYRAPAKYM
jgi:hypothetical protein